MEKKEENTAKSFRVTMLGGFTISRDGKLCLEDAGRSRKVWNLLEYLLVNRGRDISQDDLIQVCGNEESADPAKVLKNLAYRLRTMLAEHGLPAEECIIFRRGVYAWNPALPCTVDAEEFEELWKRASGGSLRQDQQLKCYLEAIELYHGRFLPRSAFEEWVVPLSTYYQRLYVECIYGAYDILSTQKNYEPMVSICNRAVSIDPYDEGIYELLIRSLIQLGRHKDALAAYEAISKVLYDDLGVNPSDSLSALYRDIMKTIKSVETDLAIIKEDLREAMGKRGAYLCHYEIFKDIYRFIARTLERTGQSVYIMLCTLTDSEDDIPPVSLQHSAMEKLKEVIGCSLRRGDLYARYSCTQYVVMLPGTNYENGCMVGKRISDNFRRDYPGHGVKLHYKLLPLDPCLQ